MLLYYLIVSFWALVESADFDIYLVMMRPPGRWTALAGTSSTRIKTATRARLTRACLTSILIPTSRLGLESRSVRLAARLGTPSHARRSFSVWVARPQGSATLRPDRRLTSRSAYVGTTSSASSSVTCSIQRTVSAATTVVGICDNGWDGLKKCKSIEVLVGGGTFGLASDT
ncbi:hypothetical protein PSPO01_09177 [Paraphaeosphaeria sporulosa]